MTQPVLSVRGLRIDLVAGHNIVDEVDLDIAAGEIVGLVGESGSGKTTVGLAVLGHARRGVCLAGGRVEIGGCSVLDASPREVRALRGSTVAYVPQDPATALNPALRIGRQLSEVVAGLDVAERQLALDRALGEVLLPSDEEFLRRYPHQLSGGQQQRVAIAMAFLGRPKLIVFDEPTTGLDVSTQAHLLQTIRTLCAEHDTAGLYISHDLAVVAELADRVAILYAGRIVEGGSASLLASGAQHPYTAGLLRALPRHDQSRLTGIVGRAPSPAARRAASCNFAPRCDQATSECLAERPLLVEAAHRSDPGHVVACLHPVSPSVATSLAVDLRPIMRRPDPDSVSTTGLQVQSLDAAYGGHQVLFGANLRVGPGMCVAIVGESGSGKTTLSRCLAGLHPEMTGTIALDGVPLAGDAALRSADLRRRLQYVFQNPYAALNPRRTVAGSLRRPIEVFEGRAAARHSTERLEAILERVALDGSFLDRYPSELSGGERQRVAIARALVCSPSVLICDEVTSALDVSVQATIVELLRDLRDDTGLAIVFVTHNLPLVRSLADRVVVVQAGRVVEDGTNDDVFSSPRDPYTATLLRHTPQLESSAV